MGSASSGFNHAVSPVLGGSINSPVGLARVVAQAAVAAAAFSIASSMLLQGLATWRAWKSAAPIRVSITALQAITQAEWSIGPPAAEIDGLDVANASTTERSKAQLKGPLAVRTPPAKSQYASKRRRTPPVEVAPEQVLLQLALQNSERVIRLWTATPQSLPARGAVRRQIEVAASDSAKAQEVITDRLTIQSAKVMTSQSEDFAAIRTESGPLEPHSVVAEQPLVLAPAEAMSESLNGRADSIQVSRPLITEAEPVSAAKPENTRLKRLTKSHRDDAWTILSSSGQSPIVFAQANAGGIREFPSVKLDTQPETSSHGKSVAMSSQSGVGVVSGWIPAGTEVRVRGASRVDYYSRDGRTSSVDSHEERFFVARNLGPGAAVVQLTQESSGDVVTAAGVPVLASSATQIDLRQVRGAQVRGHLWSSESAKATGVAHAEIRIVGVPHRLTVTNEDGSFDLGEVALPVGLAAFIEARLPGGYTHRYAVDPSRASKPLQLFLFSDERIQHLLGSLEGGVSAESGLIVASVRSDQTLRGRPVVRPLMDSSKAAPETYWLNADDSLLDPSRAPSNQGAFTQWIGVEVTANSVLAGLQSTRGRWLNVEWVPTSPGVISVLSPVE